ncbi:hypothetical protein HNR77_003854 [Paenibacillus sp. JGP012]|uniref:carbamoyltransferase C-terminal domain-containing protein n=1 Tax=Paenibacillus sp. JGP012 TaxID=2735914 RepID=UPI001607B814|nr:carbamoyltransferase C-terminal domain-containing protein [Paenibacillus sp. JGP012]MBB6022755.1 hypothetical protein [Paenibacillus sp. JGP012]
MKHHWLSLYNEEQAHKIINNLLKTYGLSMNDIIHIWGTPMLENDDSYDSTGLYPELPLHSMMHLFSSLLMETDIFYQSNMISLALDAGPDNITDPLARDKKFYAGAVSLLGKPHIFSISSPAIFWKIASERYGMEEGSLMALGSASNSEYYEAITKAPRIMSGEDINAAIDWITGLAEMIESLTTDDVGGKFSGYDERFSRAENQISMLVKILQNQSELMINEIIDQIIEKYDLDPKETYLSLSGGYALNCPSNTSVMNKYKFKGFIAPPCVNDSGISLGMGLYAFFNKLGKINFSLGHAYYGDKCTNEESVFDEYSHYIDSITIMDPREAAEDIINHPILWFNGRAEIGPRALGNRSILADPRRIEHKDKLNEIKQRQWWRPVAPIVMKERVSEWFETDYTSPFMLHAFKLIEDRKVQVPGILHLDGSSRVQTLDRSHNSLLYNVLEQFNEITDVPIICNTSLNDRGEPICNTIQEALNFALRKKMGVAYVNGKRIVLKNFDEYGNNKPLPRLEFICEPLSVLDLENANREINPFNLTEKELSIYFNYPIFQEYDLNVEKEVLAFLKIIKYYEKNKTIMY